MSLLQRSGGFNSISLSGVKYDISHIFCVQKLKHFLTGEKLVVSQCVSDRRGSLSEWILAFSPDPTARCIMAMVSCILKNCAVCQSGSRYGNEACEIDGFSWSLSRADSALKLGADEDDYLQIISNPRVKSKCTSTDSSSRESGRSSSLAESIQQTAQQWEAEDCMNFMFMGSSAGSDCLPRKQLTRICSKELTESIQTTLEQRNEYDMAWKRLIEALTQQNGKNEPRLVQKTLESESIIYQTFPNVEDLMQLDYLLVAYCYRISSDVLSQILTNPKTSRISLNFVLWLTAVLSTPYEHQKNSMMTFVAMSHRAVTNRNCFIFNNLQDIDIFKPSSALPPSLSAVLADLSANYPYAAQAYLHVKQPEKYTELNLQPMLHLLSYLTEFRKINLHKIEDPVTESLLGTIIHKPSGVASPRRGSTPESSLPRPTKNVEEEYSDFEENNSSISPRIKIPWCRRRTSKQPLTDPSPSIGTAIKQLGQRVTTGLNELELVEDALHQALQHHKHLQDELQKRFESLDTASSKLAAQILAFEPCNDTTNKNCQALDQIVLPRTTKRRRFSDPVVTTRDIIFHADRQASDYTGPKNQNYQDETSRINQSIIIKQKSFVNQEQIDTIWKELGSLLLIHGELELDIELVPKSKTDVLGRYRDAMLKKTMLEDDLNKMISFAETVQTQLTRRFFYIP